MPYERIFFLNERLNDLTKGIPRFVDFPRHVEEGIRALSEFCDYLQHVEKGRDEPLQGHYPFYLEISLIADYSDDFLSRFNNPIDNWYVRDEFPSFINILVSKVRKLHHLLPSQSNYNINTGGNTNMSGQLSTGPIHISIHHSETSHIKHVVRPNTYGHIPNSDDLVGFNGEIQILLDHLLQPHDETRVVGIVGMGGSGKTTLAKYIYHHPQINTHFTRKVWVCVSQSWEKVHIINAIWRQATGNTTATEMDYEQVVHRLYPFLSSETYLVILDDIWSIHAWYDISPALPNGNGSKVVITTRNKILLQRIDSHVHIVEPKQLDDKESFELFKRRASLPYERVFLKIC